MDCITSRKCTNSVDIDPEICDNKSCIVHRTGVSHETFIPLQNASDSVQRLNKLHEGRGLRLSSSVPNLCMEDVCSQIPDTLDGIDTSTSGYHRGCYQSFYEKFVSLEK